LWRALKDLGVASLRDGVALLPASAAHRIALEAIGAQVESDGGSYWLLDLATQGPALEEQLRRPFDRSEAYRGVRTTLAELRGELPRLDEAGARRRLRQAERDLDAVARTDFFPGPAQAQSRQDLSALIEQINRRFSPGSRWRCRVPSCVWTPPAIRAGYGPRGAACGSTGWRAPG
jgi:hypothetical protein